jgi:type I restriction enzyme S subunit
VLTAAVTGKLTEKWRDEHPEVESGELLLKKIALERVVAKTATGSGYSFKFSSDIDERYIEIEMPVTWLKTNLDSVSMFIVDCPHSTPKWSNTGKICLRTTNFLPNKLNLEEVRYVSAETHKKRIDRLKPLQGDVLYSREGGILGIACILDTTEDVCLGQRMMMFRTSKCIVNSFFSYYLNSPIVLQHVENLIGGSAAPHINIRDIKKLPFPLPPLEEQQEIVRQVDKLFALADKLEAHYQKAKTHVGKLSQSVLAKAFRGELVPQDPSDEPAEKLLARIMKEKNEKSQRPAAKRTTP